MNRIHISAIKVPAVQDVLGLTFFLGLCFGISVAGGRVAAPALHEWYGGLTKPVWTPPGWVFGPVWTLLYPLMAVAGWTVWREGRSRIAVLLFLLQLALNGAWPWLFFGFRRLDWAFWDVAALWVTLAVTLAVFFRVRRRAALLLVPYLAWVTFVGPLSFAVWRLNV